MKKKRRQKVKVNDWVTTFSVEGNQFSIGARMACASISFQAVHFLTYAVSVRDAIYHVNWENHVLQLGKELWINWLRMNHSNSNRQENNTHRRIQSFTDIEKIPGMSSHFINRFGTKTEFCGPLCKITDRQYMGLAAPFLGGETTMKEVASSIVVKLYKAVSVFYDMGSSGGKKKDSRATAMIFSGNKTISAFSLEKSIILYDSHGWGAEPGQSLLFQCTGETKEQTVHAAVCCIRGMLSTCGTNNSLNFIENVQMYSMVIFEPVTEK